jgi:hypothetical protein
MNNIKAHNIGFLTEKWNVRKQNTRQLSEDILPMPLYDDINEIKGEIMSWIEGYMDNYPESEWAEKQALLYKEIAKFCSREALGIERGESVDDAPDEYSRPMGRDKYGDDGDAAFDAARDDGKL